MKKRSAGFSVLEGLIVVLVLVGLCTGGWWVWHAGHASNKTGAGSSQLRNGNKDTERQPSAYDGWKWYEDKKLGMKFAYPSTWTVSDITTTATAAGEQGWTLTIHPISRENGDPGITVSTYPSNATIKDVDAGVNDVKVQDIVADNQTLTLAGVIEDPSRVTKPTQMYLSSCWPRDCTPRLANGRFLGVYVGSTNNDCTRGMLCPTEINTNGEKYSEFIKLLESIQSI